VTSLIRFSDINNYCICACVGDVDILFYCRWPILSSFLFFLFHVLPPKFALAFCGYKRDRIKTATQRAERSLLVQSNTLFSNLT